MLQETLNEESDELRNQLEEKSELESKHEKISKYIVRKHEKKNKSGNCLFKDKFKVGMTKNIDERLKDLNTSSPYQFKIMEIYYTSFKLIKEVFSTERISVNCQQEKNKKECKICEQSLDHKLFFRNEESICKSCYTPASLQCNKCNEIKEYQYFSKDCSKKTGYRTICKKCTLI